MTANRIRFAIIACVIALVTAVALVLVWDDDDQSLETRDTSNRSETSDEPAHADTTDGSLPAVPKEAAGEPVESADEPGGSAETTNESSGADGGASAAGTVGERNHVTAGSDSDPASAGEAPSASNPTIQAPDSESTSDGEPPKDAQPAPMPNPNADEAQPAPAEDPEESGGGMMSPP